MKLQELYALTVVGLRGSPSPTKGRRHSAQQLIVTKDPMNLSTKIKQPKKPKSFFKSSYLLKTPEN